MILAHDWPLRFSQPARAQVEALLATGCQAWTNYILNERCHGHTASLVKRQISNGTWTVRLQCNSCGRLLGSPMKRDLHPHWAEYAVWDESFEANRIAAQQAAHEQFVAERDARAELQAKQQEAWRLAYDEYLLHSPAWQAKRTLVFRRANWICEGCGDGRATQIHHLRYPANCFPGTRAWIAREMLFDLVAVCDRCHANLHDPELYDE